MLRAQADRQAQMLRAEGEAQAITTVFNAIHAGQPDQALLAYQYMQMLPTIARGDANKVWIVPSEIDQGARGSGQRGRARLTVRRSRRAVKGEFKAPEKIDVQAEIEQQNAIEAAKAAAHRAGGDRRGPAVGEAGLSCADVERWQAVRDPGAGGPGRRGRSAAAAGRDRDAGRSAGRTARSRDAKRAGAINQSLL